MELSGTHLDLKGLKCPLPVLRTRKALRRLRPGDLLIVECTDPLAPIDIVHLARKMGSAIEHSSQHGRVHVFHIRA
ncbi:MAG: sulfurtransferase TusA family protein [Xanthobacteraceae bacterium]